MNIQHHFDERYNKGKNLKFSEQFEYMIDYTIEFTKLKLFQLLNTYHDNIFIKQIITDFTPANNVNNFMIDGLNVPGSYVYNAFMKLTTQTNVTLKISNNIIALIKFYHRNTPNDLIIIKKCIQRIYCIINVFGNIDNLKIYNDMEIDILLYDAPRIMTGTFDSDSNEINELGKKYFFNCTCGYATIDNNKFKLCVTRKNGCLGLLTHELGHICELDLGYFDGNKYNFPNDRLKGWKKIIKKYFDIRPSCNIGSMTEGINNGNSSIIHAMFIAIECPSKGSVLNAYKYHYKNEFLHSILMLCRLLKWFKYSSLDELLMKVEQKYTQKSLLLEYILVRCIYLMHFNVLGVFKKCKFMPNIEDNQYLLSFFKKMIESIEILNIKLHTIDNNKTISMEYYYYT